jgi:hypothetical protein
MGTGRSRETFGTSTKLRGPYRKALIFTQTGLNISIMTRYIPLQIRKCTKGIKIVIRDKLFVSNPVYISVHVRPPLRSKEKCALCGDHISPSYCQILKQDHNAAYSVTKLHVPGQSVLYYAACTRFIILLYYLLFLYVFSTHCVHKTHYFSLICVIRNVIITHVYYLSRSMHIYIYIRAKN